MEIFEQPMDVKIAVIGLGYVGLPLAVHFGNWYETVGFDINSKRVDQLLSCHDSTNEVTSKEIKNSVNLSLISDPELLGASNLYIITVPTPVDSYNRPDLSHLVSASTLVGNNLSYGDVVVYESTVFPGCTEEICIPILENQSGLVFNQDFFVGYSPERVNPGDHSRSLASITKVVSGSTCEVADFLVGVYKTIITADIHRAPTIKVAEGAKIIENAQRDLNIAFMNELTVLFDKLEIRMDDVLKAANTKWNFLDFKPGLVGGHCISVDPYYLLHKAQEVGFYPEVIWAGRRANNSVVPHIFGKSIKLLNQKSTLKENSNVLILGFSFKENCPDVRNTRVHDLYLEYINAGFNVDIYDPVVDLDSAMHEYSVDILDSLPDGKKYGLILISVAHDEFREIGMDSIRSYGSKNCVIFDVKGVFPRDEVDASL